MRRSNIFWWCFFVLLSLPLSRGSIYQSSLDIFNRDVNVPHRTIRIEPDNQDLHGAFSDITDQFPKIIETSTFDTCVQHMLRDQPKQWNEVETQCYMKLLSINTNSIDRPPSNAQISGRMQKRRVRASRLIGQYAQHASNWLERNNPFEKFVDDSHTKLHYTKTQKLLGMDKPTIVRRAKKDTFAGHLIGLIGDQDFADRWKHRLWTRPVEAITEKPMVKRLWNALTSEQMGNMFYDAMAGLKIHLERVRERFTNLQETWRTKYVPKKSSILNARFEHSPYLTGKPIDIMRHEPKLRLDSFLNDGSVDGDDETGQQKSPTSFRMRSDSYCDRSLPWKEYLSCFKKKRLPVLIGWTKDLSKLRDMIKESKNKGKNVHADVLKIKAFTGFSDDDDYYVFIIWPPDLWRFGINVIEWLFHLWSCDQTKCEPCFPYLPDIDYGCHLPHIRFIPNEFFGDTKECTPEQIRLCYSPPDLGDRECGFNSPKCDDALIDNSYDPRTGCKDLDTWWEQLFYLLKVAFTWLIYLLDILLYPLFKGGLEALFDKWGAILPETGDGSRFPGFGEILCIVVFSYGNILNFIMLFLIAKILEHLLEPTVELFERLATQTREMYEKEKEDEQFAFSIYPSDPLPPSLTGNQNIKCLVL